MSAPDLPEDLAWHPLDPSIKGIHCLRVGGCWGLDVARVQRQADRSGWGSTVGMHLEDWSRRRHAVARSEETAMRWAGRWAVANLDALRAAAAARNEDHRRRNRYGVGLPLITQPEPFVVVEWD